MYTLRVQELLEISSAPDVVLLVSSNQDSWEKNQDLKSNITIHHQKGRPVLSRLKESSCLEWRNSDIMDLGWKSGWCSLGHCLWSVYIPTHDNNKKRFQIQNLIKRWLATPLEIRSGDVTQKEWSDYASTLRGTSRHLWILWDEQVELSGEWRWIKCFLTFKNPQILLPFCGELVCSLNLCIF